MTIQPSRDAIVADIRQRLKQRNVRSALEVLNRNSQHRFTAVFRFEGSTLRNVHLIDREDRSVERCPDLPVLESYCVYVRDTAKRFVTEASLTDPRVEGHAKQKLVQSYCGLPLINSRGEMFGTVCHFDFQPLAFSMDEITILEEIASELVTSIEAGDWKPQRDAAGNVG